MNLSPAREKSEIITEMYLQGISTLDIAKQLNASKGTINKILRASGVPIRKSFEERKRLIEIDESFFHIPNTESSYWAGFISADGCVDHQSRLRVALQARDLSHLELFRDAISPKHKIYYRGNGYNTYSLEIYSKPIVEDLYNHYNITPNKSLTLARPNISDFSCMVAYCIGYIDGDGSLGHVQDGTFYFHALGTQDVLSFLKSVVEKFNSDLSLNIRRRDNVFVIATTGNKIKTALARMINYVQVPFMERKWQSVSG